MSSKFNWVCTAEGPSHRHDTVEEVKEHFERTYRESMKKITSKPIPGIRLQVPIYRAPWCMPLPLDDAYRLKECKLYPEYVHEGIQYTLHACDYHEYVIIEWIPTTSQDNEVKVIQ